MPSGFADQLRNQLDIVEVLGAYLPLRKRGREFEACCPFHQEKTASFKVSPTKQIFHCFGCHKGGDVIRFVMEFEHLDFRSAMIVLAERHGIPVAEYQGSERSSEEEKRRMALFEIHKVAAEFFAAQLHAGGEGAEYVRRRGISEDLIEAFQLGFAPNRRPGFLEFARKKGYSNDLLILAGLVKDQGDGRGPYDAFRRRVIFPIGDAVGRIVAFGGRALEKEQTPKYLNSPETPIYQKGQFLYAYHLAKTPAKERGYAIVTEGYMDAIACHQFGFTNAVASLGTAFTDAMARLLKRICPRIVFLYDGDAPGQKAMYGGTQILLAHDLQVHVVALPSEDDPDSLLRREGAGALAGRIDRAPDHFEFFLRAAAARHDRRTLQGRIAIVDYLKELVGRARNPLAQHDYVRRLSEFLAVPENTVAQTLFGRGGRTQEVARADIGGQDRSKEITDKHEIGLLRLLIEHERVRTDAQELVNPQWLFDVKVRSWFQRLLGAAAGPLSAADLLATAENEEDAVFLRTILLSEDEPAVDYERAYPEIVAYLASRFVGKLVAELDRELVEAEKANDGERLAAICRKRAEISRNKLILGRARYGQWSELPVLGTGTGTEK